MSSDSVGAKDELSKEDEEETSRFNDVSDVELPEYVTEYLEDEVAVVFSENTYRNRKVAYKQFALYCNEKGISFRDVEHKHIRQFGLKLRKDGYKKRTIETKLYSLSALYQHLRRWDEIAKNPLEHDDFDMEFVKTTGKYGEIRYIEIEDYKKIIEAVDSLRDELLLRLLWDCGVRSKELVNIEVDDVNRKEQSITILTAKKRDDEKRKVYYRHRTESCLRKWLDRGGRDAFLKADESDYLLLGKQSEQLNPNRPTEIVRKYAKNAGVQAKLDTSKVTGVERKKVTAHAFRHSYAVHRVKKGMPIPFLSDLMGHSDIKQTREYLKFREDDIQKAEEKYAPHV